MVAKIAEPTRQKKKVPEGFGESERLGSEIEVRNAQIEQLVNTSRRRPWREVELDEEIRNLQSGGCFSSQSNGCCFDLPVVLEPYTKMGATQAWQQLSFLQEVVSRVFGAQHTKYQPHPGGERGDENGKSRGEERRVVENGQPPPVYPDEGFPARSVFEASLCLHGIKVKAMETSLDHLEKEVKVGADSSAGK